MQQIEIASRRGSRDRVGSIDQYNKRTADPAKVLEWAYKRYGSKVVLGTGLGPSGVVLIHMSRQAGLEIPVFFLDTGYHFPETYQFRQELEDRLGIRIEAIKPEPGDTIQKGGELHPDSHGVERCCEVRKVLPLRKYLQDKEAWITGIRRDQGVSRAGVEAVEWDSANNLRKVCPLAYWTRQMVWQYIRHHGLPSNPLHKRGYPSIGCFPCTVPVEGEIKDERAGRWFGQEKTECGIHLR